MRVSRVNIGDFLSILLQMALTIFKTRPGIISFIYVPDVLNVREKTRI